MFRLSFRTYMTALPHSLTRDKRENLEVAVTRRCQGWTDWNPPAS